MPRKPLMIAAGVMALFAVLGTPAAAADWPTHQQNNQRTGVTSEKLAATLHLQWTYVPRHAPMPAWGDPQPKPVERFLELPRVRLDDTFRVAVVGDRLVFASSGDGAVRCLDSTSGATRWTFFTGAPVRLAPTVWQGKVYVGSDDGFVYCLKLADGSVVWKFRAAPRDKLVLGHGRLMSLWPVRSGVLVEGGIAYFTAGIFPFEGLYMYAVQAADGSPVWTNDTFDRGGSAMISPQGHLVATDKKLIVPSGRATPAVFDRNNGLLVLRPRSNHRLHGLYGGVRTFVADGMLYNGTEQVIGYDLRDAELKYVWQGRQLVLHGSTGYLATSGELIAFDRGKYPLADVHPAYINKTRKTYQGWVKHFQDRIAKAKPSRSRDAMVARLKELQRRLATINKVGKNAGTLFHKSIRWRAPVACPDALMLTAKSVVAGGPNRVVAVDTAAGQTHWQHEVQGKAKGLAAAGGKLYVSTDAGHIHCFGPKAVASPKRIDNSVKASSTLTPLELAIHKGLASEILKEAGTSRGYALVLGGDGKLAMMLAQNSELVIALAEPDAKKAEKARRLLARTGLLGRRVTVHTGALTALPHPDYFANLIVCTGPEPATPPAELVRMLKPVGGVALVGRPMVIGQPDPPAVKAWLAELDTEGFSVSLIEVGWAKVVRGTLPGAGNWTHQYADAGNTACSDDTRVKGPLGILWFGYPGPGQMVNRHASAASPVSLDGRLFVQGENVIMAYDAYNGVKLWERDIAGAMRRGMKTGGVGNLTVSKRGLFVSLPEKCLLLDAATGKTLKVFDPPRAANGKPRRWGYTACHNDRLLGATTAARNLADAVFSIDLKTGKRWVYAGKAIRQNSVAAHGRRVFLIDGNVTPAERAAALKAHPTKPRINEHGKPMPPDVRRVVALNAATGKPVWAKPLNVSDCVKVGPGGGDLTLMVSRNVVVLAAQPWNGHFWRQFFAGQFKRRSLIALSAEDGKTLWSGHKGYRSRPLIVGETIYAEPWAYNLYTGEPKQRTHPVTGRETPWQMSRPGHHCGCIAAAPNHLFFRSGTTAYYDLTADDGTAHFGAQRPGCWINFIPASGLLMMPEASSGCVCPFPIQCTVVFQPRRENRAWGTYSAIGPMKPVKHLAVNFGAPGDRRDTDGRLWLAYPRPRTSRLALNFSVGVSISDGGYYRQNADRIDAPKSPRRWVFASGVRGVTRVTVPLAEKDAPPATYTVRLYFADPDHAEPGKRVFDIKFPGDGKGTTLDVAKEAGGSNKPFVLGRGGVKAGESMVIEFAAKPGPAEAPIVCGIEIIRTSE